MKSFSGYGDEKVRKRLKSEIVHPRKFLDVLAELAYASSHIGRHAIFPSQETGMADFEVNLGGRYRPLVVDCKRLGAETRDARIATVIKKPINKSKDGSKAAMVLQSSMYLAGFHKLSLRGKNPLNILCHRRLNR